MPKTNFEKELYEALEGIDICGDEESLDEMVTSYETNCHSPYANPVWSWDMSMRQAEAKGDTPWVMFYRAAQEALLAMANGGNALTKTQMNSARQAKRVLYAACDAADAGALRVSVTKTFQAMGHLFNAAPHEAMSIIQDELRGSTEAENFFKSQDDGDLEALLEEIHCRMEMILDDLGALD